METIPLTQPTKTISNKVVWTGRIISGIMIAFLLMDSIMKIMMHPMHVEGSTKLGFSENAVRPIGIALLLCTILYIIPRTAVLGAMFLTAYLGGAVAIMVLAGEAFYFPIVFAVLVWGGLYLRNEKLRAAI